MTALEARDLTKQYGETRALDCLNLDIEPGEIYCLLGPNGAGKTTTINLFLNFIEPTGGKAFIKGMDVTRHPLETKRHLAYIPEQVSLYRNLTGLENLRFVSALAGQRAVDEASLLRVLEEVGLAPEAAARRVATYSKGMRQKVGLAIALARRADVLLLDEPTSGLDPTAASELATLLARMRDAGAAVLMTTHDLFRAKASGTRIGIMQGGRLVTSMRAAEVDHHELEDVYLAHVARAGDLP
jgi:ABC-2 type transport system ATP-binding protein